MANQIGRFFAHEADEKAILDIADHLKKFWDPRMRRAIFAYVDDGGQGLQPRALKAVQALKADTPSA